MAIIDCFDKRTGITYVYDSKSYRDKETGKPRAKRRLIGKRDSTGAIVPTRRKASKTTNSDIGSENETTSSPDSSRLVAALIEKNTEIDVLKKRVSSLEKKLSTLATVLDKANGIIKQT